MEQLISILITTKHRGVFYAEVPASKDLTQTTLTDLKNCRMAIKWATTNGIQQLCKEGPNRNSRIGDVCDIPVLHDVTSIMSVTPEATEKWKAHSNA